MQKKRAKPNNASELAQPETNSGNEPIIELPYDDDPEWNASFEKSLPTLEKLAARALNNYHKAKSNKLQHAKHHRD